MYPPLWHLLTQVTSSTQPADLPEAGAQPPTPPLAPEDEMVQPMKGGPVHAAPG